MILLTSNIYEIFINTKYIFSSLYSLQSQSEQGSSSILQVESLSNPSKVTQPEVAESGLESKKSNFKSPTYLITPILFKGPPVNQRFLRHKTMLMESSKQYIHLLNHLFRSVSTLNIDFILWVEIQCCLFILLLKLFQFRPLGALSVGACAPLTYPHQCGVLVVVAVVFGALPYFLALQDALGSSHIFLVPVLESADSPRSSSSFYWTMILETKNWVLGVLLGLF